MEFRILGPVTAIDDADDPLEMTPVLKALLGILLTEVNRLVPKDRLRTLRDDTLAKSTLDGYISELRALLRTTFGRDAELPKTQSGMVQLTIPDPSVIDHHRFRAHMIEAESTDDDHAAIAAFAGAISEFRGIPFEGLKGPLVSGVRVLLDEQHRKACYERARRMIGLGLHAEALEELIAHPDRWRGDERLFALRVDALVAIGRRADARAAFEQFDVAYGATDDLSAQLYDVLDRSPRHRQPAPREQAPDLQDPLPVPARNPVWEELLEPDLELGENPLPSALLQPEYHVVPFERADDLLPRLTTWLAGPEPIDLRLLTGAGGAGKTRVGAELVRHARDLSTEWVAGFVRFDVESAALVEAARESTKLLLVVDYAEGRAREVSALLKSMIGRPAGHGSVRILLLARSRGPWLDVIRREKDATIARLVSRMSRESLPPLPRTAMARSWEFERAVAAFLTHVPAVGSGAVTVPPDLDDDRYDRVLDVHAVALAALLDTAAAVRMPERNNPLERVLDHEERYWLASVESSDLPEPHLARLRMLVSVATLFGANDIDGAHRLLAALGTLADVSADGVDRYRLWLASMYPGPAALNPLRPDRLGEDLVATTLTTTPTMAGDIAVHADDTQLTRAFTVLARAAQRHDVRGYLVALIEPSLTHRIPIAMTIATQVDSPTLVDVLDGMSTGDDTMTEAIVERLPSHSLALSSLAVSLTKALLRIELRRDPVDRPFVAEVRHNLALRLMATGGYDEALTQLGLSVAVYRELARSEPDDEVELATALASLANAYARLGMYDDGLRASEESAEMLTNVIANPSTDLTFSSAELRLLLATSLTNRGNLLADAGSPDEAVRSINRAVDQVRRLIAEEREQPPTELLAQLANSLENLGSAHASNHDYRESRDVCVEAVEVYRELDAADPDQFRDELIRGLHNLAGAHAELGEWAIAAETGKEALSLARALIERHGDVYLVRLADVLNNMAATLRRLDEHEDALRHVTEAVSIYRRLATEQPGTQLEALAAALHNLANLLEDTGKPRDAVDAYEEAVEIYRKLADPRPQVVAPDLAEVLTGLANARYVLDDSEAALAFATEAVGILRETLHAERTAIRRKLASALHVAAAAAFDLGDLDTATRDGTLAVGIYRELVDRSDLDLRESYADALHLLARILLGADENRQAADAFDDTIALLRTLAAEARSAGSSDYDKYRDELAGALTNSGLCASGRQDDDTAVVLLDEALRLRRELLDTSQETREDLAEVLNNLADTLCDADRHQEAFPLADESARLATELVREGFHGAESIAVYAWTTLARTASPDNRQLAVDSLVKAWTLAERANDGELKDLVQDGLRELGGSRRTIRRAWAASTHVPFPAG